MLKGQITNFYKPLSLRKLFLLLTVILSFSLPASLLSSITPVKAVSLSLPPETLYAGYDTGLRGDDNYSSDINIGFSFTYYGNTYTQFKATTNGLIYFGSGSYYEYSNHSIPYSGTPNNAIYCFWDDLMSYGDTQLVLYRTIGDVGSRELIVQWTNYGYFNSDLPMGTFQIILYEGSNNIRMQYRQLLTDPRSYGDSATIGLENASGTVASQYSYNTVSLDNEQSILWTWNGSNNYTYNAGAAYEGVYLYKDNPPPNVPALSAPANGSAGVSTSPTFSWSSTLNADSYNLTVSQYANLSSPVISQTGLTSTSYAGSGLSVGPTYYWGVEAVNTYGSTWSSIWTFTTAAGNSAPNDISLSNNTIAAGLPANTEVGTLSTTDPDAGDTFTYTLVEGGGSSDNGSFTISGSSLRTNASLSAGEYTIRVRSTDQGELYTEKSFTITVGSSNNTPTDISLSSSSVAENQGADAVVGTLSTTDPDSGDSFTYTLVSGTGDTDNASFNISGNSLRASASLDFEAKSSYSVRVRSTDSGGLFTEKQFALSVTDVVEDTTTTIVSDNPDPSVENQNYSVSVTVAPSSGAGTPTGTVNVGDGTNSCTITLSSGSGSCTLSSSVSGTFTITATYNGDANWNTSNDTESHVVSDTTPPTVTVEQASGQSDPTNGTPIVFDVLFNEPIQSLSPDDVSFTGSTAPGTLSASIGGAGPDFKIFVSGMTGSGDVVVSIPAGRVQDLAGNYNLASTSTDNTVTYDITPPTVTIEQSASQPDPTNSEPIVFDVEFSEQVLGFTSTDVSISGMANTPTITVNGTGATYTVEVSGVADGEIISADIISNSALDLAGNPSLESTSVDNLVEYDISSIELVMDAGVIGNPGNIVIAQNGNYLTKFTEISVEFDSDAYNPSGSTDEDDVTNPDNYYLLRPGDNYVFNVSTCPQIAQIGSTEELDDIVVPIGPVSYDNNGGAGPFIASLTVNNGMRLPIDKYRLIICGSTTILDLAGNPLNDGVDVLIDFSIQELPDSLPNTGFPMGAVTTIPEKPEASTYNSTGMFISLPTLGVSTQIIGVPLESNGWNTSWLGNYAGFLEGSVFPTWNGNTVITGHVWTATNQPGIFVDLEDLKYGDVINIFAWGQVYTYEVRSNRVVSDTNVISVMRSENRDWVTLMTCDTYDPETGTFMYRRVVRAILIAID